MKPGKTELRLNAEIEKRGALFAVLLDPDTSDEAAFVKAGSLAAENGADLLLVGGSYLGNFTLPKQVAALKAAVDLPVILFPGGASQVVPGFDAMLFMTLVSGRNPNYLIDEQVRGGALVRALNMEAIPTAYQLINSGKRTTVEYISGTMPVPSNKPKLSMVNSIAAELMGMRYVYLEAGSGAEEPVPVEHILRPQGDRDDHHYWWWHQGPADRCCPRGCWCADHRDWNPLGKSQRPGAPQGIRCRNPRERLVS